MHSITPANKIVIQNSNPVDLVELIAKYIQISIQEALDGEPTADDLLSAY